MDNIQKYGLLQSVNCIIRGAPFVNCTEWKLWTMPRFPFFYTILSGLFFGLWCFLTFGAFYVYNGITKTIFNLLLVSAFGIFIFLFYNCMLLFWFRLIKKYSCRECEKKEIIEGGRRIAYFSTAFQFLPLAAIDLAFIVEKNFRDSRWLMMVLIVFILIVYILRLAAVFMSIKREEPYAKYAPFIGCIPCVDALLILGILRLLGNIF
ncbi:MAG: hypothetical protein A2Y07_03265 [Planctomycetes bacterium GWF2_50_10]|nr:MAG: hypothetical protein A2Y07_03265 [Planctomycetes bacterium GWF2_50_10]